MVRRALLVGCNYPGEPCELKGSANDVDRMHVLLTKKFGFKPTEILVLVDIDPRSRQPTGANIRKSLRKLVDGAEPGDVLFFHFSGHGTQVPPDRGRRDETGYEECIVPSDMNLLTDDDFRELVDRIPPGCNFTFIADACHSGGLIDNEKEQIGDRYSMGEGGPLGGRPRPPLRPEAGGGGLTDLVAEGIEAFSGAGGGKQNSFMGMVGQALGSRLNIRGLPGDDDREYDPKLTDPYARQPGSPYDRGYADGGIPSGYPTERPYDRRNPIESEMGGYEGRGSGYDRREAREPERSYERTYDTPGSSYAGGIDPEATYGRPLEDPRGYGRPSKRADDEFNYSPRGASYERPLRAGDDDYGYPARPVRPTEDDYRYSSEGASRRLEKGGYGYAEEDPYDRYHTYDSREDDKRRFDREGYRKEHDRRGRYGEGSEYEDSSRYPVKYQSEYSVGSGNYGGYPDAGVRYGGYLDSGDYGYSGKPHHTPLKNKSLPLNILTSILSQRTGRSVKPGNIYQNLYDLFGEDASPTVKVFVRILLNKLEDYEGEDGGRSHGLLGKIGGLASSLLKTKIDNDPSGGYPEDRQGEELRRHRRRQRRNYDAGILISACEPHESSADANPTNDPRDAYGALSNAIQTVIGESRGYLTNRQVVMAARRLLNEQGYKQHPCLYCSDRNADAYFLQPMPM
uniref:Peptidase C14 caspase domain-containing protein n=1 Tax=Physcomitrium patens TaxID=3218 RepID=A0A7I4BQ31_PHYPA